MNKDIAECVKITNALTSVVLGASQTGVIIDTDGFNSLAISIAMTAYTSGNITLSFKESDDSGMSGATAITSTFYRGDLTPIVATGETKVGLYPSKRYVQTTLTGASSPSMTGQGTAVLSHAFNAPVA
jgi:hypothetical protein